MNDTPKDLTAIVFLKDGVLVRGFRDDTSVGELKETIRSFQDNGLDKIILFDLSDDDAEHEKNLHTIRQVADISEIPVYVGGNINDLEDIKKILYAGCRKVILNALKARTKELAEDGAQRFGKERLALSIFNVNVFFKQKEDVEHHISELIVLDERLAGTMSNVTEIPYTLLMENAAPEKICSVLQSDENIQGVSCSSFVEEPEKVPGLKQYLKARGVCADHLTSSMEWGSFKLNSDGLIPVIVQDYRTNEVLMLAYMNEEAYETTLAIGKMTYYSRSRKELWIKGMTSGHFQYVKSLTVDCDNDTILAKVSQVGAACHTGNRTCFFQDLVRDENTDKNLLEVLEQQYRVIRERKDHPKKGSYTNYLFEKGLDKILKKIGEESTEIVIASKNSDKENVKYEIADYLYYLMVLMAEKDISFEEVLEELVLR